MLGLFQSLSVVGRWHIVWNFPRICRRSTISFMCPSSENVFEFQLMLLRWRSYSWSRISSIQSTRSKLLTSRLELLEIKPANSIRCNGATTSSEKPHGKLKSFLNLNIRNCYKPTKVPNFLPTSQFNFSIKSRDEISFRGRDCNTSGVNH